MTYMHYALYHLEMHHVYHFVTAMEAIVLRLRIELIYHYDVTSALMH